MARRHSSYDDAYLLWKGKHCPIVEVELIHGNDEIRTLAYADTGATYSVFHSDYCEELGLVLRDGDRIDITVGDGGIIPVYIHPLAIRIEELSLRGAIGFSDRLGTGINILGRKDILDTSMVCFDGKNKEIVWHV